MKRNANRIEKKRALLWISSLTLALALAVGGLSIGSLLRENSIATAETAQVASAEPVSDPSPAVYVAQKNANSVVGVVAGTQTWNRSTGEVEETPRSQGSGVVIAEGGYVLTNYHVVEDCDSFKVLLPSGEKVEATLTGSDSSLDLAVLQVSGDATKELVPVSVGSTNDLAVGSTVVAIGNPGGEVLANTVTQGIVSALERSSVNGKNTTRNVNYIQHDAAINSGNSGGGLFNYKGELVGINTLKYAGSVYSTVTFEGLGFAIPVDTAYPIAMQLIENGTVIRPQMGISVNDCEGPDEPMSNYPPASVCIMGVNAGSPAEAAGLKQYDFIYAINGERITSFRELTGVLDKFQAGDTVSVTVVRYNSVYPVTNSASSYGSYPFGSFFGGYGFGNGSSSQSSSGSTSITVGGGYDFVTVDVVLELPEGSDN